MTSGTKTATVSDTEIVESAIREFESGLRSLGLLESLQSLEEAEGIGRRAALSVAAEQVWEDTLGPLLTSAEARRLLGGISREALSKKVRVGSAMRLRDERGLIRYPAWQFDPVAQQTYPALVEVIKEYRKKDVSDSLLAGFCVTSQEELNDLRPVDALMTDENIPGFFTAARRNLAALTD